MKKSLKVLSVFGSLTGLVSSLVLAAIVGGYVSVPPRLDTLPGRPAGIAAPTVEATDSFGGAVTGRHNLHLSYSMTEVLAAHSPKLSNAGANAGADAVAALMNTGYLKIYNGSQAATADTAVSGQTLGATLRFSSTAFGSSSAGVATANTITSDTNAANTITATWFRILKSDNSTVVMDGSVCTSGCDINLATTSIVAMGTVSVSAFTYTQSKS